MFGLFKKDPVKALEKKVKATFEEARDVQRSGDVVAAAEIYQQAEKLQEELEALKAEQG